jgi:propionate catabolism operon transcriptional regulator
MGETGTGKEMIAQSIHNEKYGSERPFVAINCATLPEPLLESELFGYAPRAFTGAGGKRKKGFFELAHGGTLLLDEIGELPVNLQSRLLRVMEERVVQPLGSDRVIPIDIRIIASTNRDLEQEVAEGKFRADLFYRLNVLQLKVPPLRERKEDIKALFTNFISQLNPKCPTKNFFSTRLQKVLREYNWPGNVRELRNIVERLAILSPNFTQSPGNISEWLKLELKEPLDVQATGASKDSSIPKLKELERAWIEALCESTTLSQEELAKRLGVSRTTLWKMRKPL